MDIKPIALVISALPFAVLADVNDGLVAHWSFDEEVGGYVMDAVSSYQGQLSSNHQLLNSPRGKSLSVLQALGSDELVLDPAFMDQVSNALCVSYWSLGYDENSENNVLYANDANGNRVLRNHQSYRGGNLYSDMGNDVEDASNYDRLQASKPASLTTDSWHHYVYCKDLDAGRMSLYFDGELIRKVLSRTQGFSLLDSFKIGNRYQGQIDELRFYNVQLSDQTILDLATDNFGPVDSDGDGYPDSEDAFPNDASEWLDSDGDGVGNNSDEDDDNDGLSDADELSYGTDPLLSDTDGDGVGDFAEISFGTDPLDSDSDNDGVLDGADTFPWDASKSTLTSHSIPATIQAEDYDVGGQGVAYVDTESDNRGSVQYRPEWVDTDSHEGDKVHVGWFRGGESMNYRLTVPASGYYDFTFYLGSTSSNVRKLTLKNNSTVLANVEFLSTTQVVRDFQATSAYSVYLEAGEQVLTIESVNGGARFDRFEVTASVVDTDGDGVEDTLDAFPNDPAASLDGDGDRYPDEWNTGKTAADSTSGLELDVFPGDSTEWGDLDGDGVGDNLDAYPDDATQFTIEDTPMKSVSQVYLSSEGWGGIASNAIDGSYSSWVHSGSTRSTEWFHLELANQELVTRLHLSPRDGFDARLAESTIVVSTDPIVSTTLSEALTEPGVSSYTLPSVAPFDVEVDRQVKHMRMWSKEGQYVNFSEIELFSNDLDEDGIPNELDIDIDNDGVVNGKDAFPDKPQYANDVDGDGVPDSYDPDLTEQNRDSDFDEIVDSEDAFPYDSGASVDADLDGIPDVIAESGSSEQREVDTDVDVPSNLNGRMNAINEELEKLNSGNIRDEFTLEALIERIDLSSAGLESVESAVIAGDIELAGELLLAHYRTKFAEDAISFGVDSLTEKQHDNFFHHFWGDDSEQFYLGDSYDWVSTPSVYAEWTIQHTREFGDSNLILDAYKRTGNKAFYDEIVARVVSYFEHAYPFKEDQHLKFDYGVDHPFSNTIRSRILAEQLVQLVNDPNMDVKTFAYMLNAIFHSADFVSYNYTATGNHLTAELENNLLIGLDFIELKRASEAGIGWVEDVISRTSTLLFEQVYPDGMNIELSSGYHGDYAFKFRNYYNLASENGYGDSYSQAYKDLLKKTFDAAMGFHLPNFRRTAFGDGWPRLSGTKYFEEYADVDPKHEYLATYGQSGTPFRNTMLDWGGYYGLRSDWGFDGGDGIGLILKNGDQASWHNQPDNMTFELRAFGRTLISDASQQAYGSSDPDTIAMRDKYKQTRVHNTVTLDNANTGFKHQANRWLEDEVGSGFSYDLLEVQNQSYDNLLHQRSVIFFDKKYFVIVDKLSGDSDAGTLRAHFQFANENELDKAQVFNDQESVLDPNNLQAYTRFSENSSRKGNLVVKGWEQTDLTMANEMNGTGPYALGAGFGVITTGMDEFERRAFAFEMPRKSGEQYFVTAIIPFEGDNSNSTLTPNVSVDFDVDSQMVTLVVGSEIYELLLPEGDYGAVDTDGDSAINLWDSAPFDSSVN